MNKTFFDKSAAFLLRIIGQTATAICPSLLSKAPLDYSGQDANDYIRQRIDSDEEGLMMTKLGTYELKAFVNFYSRYAGLRTEDVSNLLHYRYHLYRSEQGSMDRLCNNAGFFPNDIALGERYARLFAEDWKQVDVLASYQKEEAYINSLHINNHVVRVDLNGYYAPYFWENPWSMALRDKRVLVVHPFVESIRKQYARRRMLFDNPEVLPPFRELITIQAVQSLIGNRTPYADWFEALDAMKDEMDHQDYDVALIGCGAYGFHLAAHAKRQGKTAIHLASMVQMLFGIYGHRWENDPLYHPFILPSWIRPDSAERPAGAELVENGCYW